MSRNSPVQPQLVQRAAQGNDEALSSLICARQEQALRLASLVGPPDAQARAHLMDEPSPHNPVAPAASHPSPGWVSSVRLRTLRMLPSRMRRGLEDAEPGAVSPAEAVTLNGLLERWRLILTLHHAVANLPREYREVLVLSDLEGLDLAQVGWLLDLNETELCARLLQARELLREQLGGEASQPAT